MMMRINRVIFVYSYVIDIQMQVDFMSKTLFFYLWTYATRRRNILRQPLQTRMATHKNSNIVSMETKKY